MIEIFQIETDNIQPDQNINSNQLEGLLSQNTIQQNINLNIKSTSSSIISQNESCNPDSTLNSPKSSCSISYGHKRPKWKLHQLSSDTIMTSDSTTISDLKENLTLQDSQDFKANTLTFLRDSFKIIPFSDDFYESIEKFLDDQNLYIIDPSCFYQPQNFNKKLTSLTKYKQVLSNNNQYQIDNFDYISTNILVNDTIANTNTTTTTITTISNIPDKHLSHDIKSSSLLQRRLERSMTVKIETNILGRMTTITEKIENKLNLNLRLSLKEKNYMREKGAESVKSLSFLDDINQHQHSLNMNFSGKIDMIDSNSYVNPDINTISGKRDESSTKFTKNNGINTMNNIPISKHDSKELLDDTLSLLSSGFQSTLPLISDEKNTNQCQNEDLVLFSII